MKKYISTWHGVSMAALITTIGTMFVSTGFAWLLYDADHLAVGLRTTPFVALLTAPPFAVFIWSQVRKNIILQDELQHIIDRDRLTNVGTRDYFFGNVTRDANTDGVVLMVDIDHFKPVNDTYGHLTGDGVIKHTAAILRDSVRDTDLVARFGGEEFVIFLPKRDMTSGFDVAERMREAIASNIVIAETREISVTVSIGGAFKTGRENIDAAIKAADAALYRAKTQGRNRTVFAAELDDCHMLPLSVSV